MEWLEQLTRVLITVQQLAAATRHLAAVERPDQLTQATATVLQKLAAAVRQPAAVEWLEQLTHMTATV